MNFIVCVCVSTLIIFTCSGLVNSNADQLLDSVLMSESLLNPLDGLFEPKLIKRGYELCKDDEESFIAKMTNKTDILDGAKNCKKVEALSPTLNFAKEEEMQEVCEADVLQQLRSCAIFLEMFANECFQKLNIPRKGISNNLKFTEKFTQLFCEKRRWFIDNLVKDNKFVCSTPKTIADAKDCNERAEKYLEEHPSQINYGLDDFCVKFRIMELCTEKTLKQCPNVGSVSLLINDLKNKLECQEYNFLLSAAENVSSLRKFGIILTFAICMFNLL